MTNYMIIKQLVSDLAQFQASFNELKPVRERYGLKDLGEFRAAEESDIVIVMLEVTDVARAKEYWHSIVLAQGRMNAGAVGSVPAGTGVEAGNINQVRLTNGLVRDAIAGKSGAERRLTARPILFRTDPLCHDPVETNYETKRRRRAGRSTPSNMNYLKERGKAESLPGQIRQLLRSNVIHSEKFFYGKKKIRRIRGEELFQLSKKSAEIPETERQR